MKTSTNISQAERVKYIDLNTFSLRKLANTILHSVIWLLLLSFVISCSDSDSEDLHENCVENNPEFIPEAFAEQDSLKTRFYNSSRVDFVRWPTEFMSFRKEILSYTIELGANTVFTFRNFVDPSPSVDGDEYYEVIFFSINSEEDAFLIESESNFNDATAYYLRTKESDDKHDYFGRTGFDDQQTFFLWAFDNIEEEIYVNIESGCIKGKKLSYDEWQIDMNIGLRYQNDWVDRMVSEVFIRN